MYTLCRWSGLCLAYITVTVRCAAPSAGLYHWRGVRPNVSTSFEYVRAAISFHRPPYIESLSNNLHGWFNAPPNGVFVSPPWDLPRYILLNGTYVRASRARTRYSRNVVDNERAFCR